MAKLAGIKIMDIDWCVEDEDVWNEFDNQTDDEIKAEIEEIKAGLPTEEFIPTNKQNLAATLGDAADLLSDKYGWLVTSFNYNLVDDEGKVLV
jgi:hypothetical protein